MATMVKEKKRPKSKQKKDKSIQETPLDNETVMEEDIKLTKAVHQENLAQAEIVANVNSLSLNKREDEATTETEDIKTIEDHKIEREKHIDVDISSKRPVDENEFVATTSSYAENIPEIFHELPKAHVKQTFEPTASEEATAPENTENDIPSAPVFEEPQIHPETPQIQYHVPTNVLKAVPLDEAVKMYCEREMAEIKAMSEREEALVQAGPISGPEHPLVDLLATFKRSLSTVERVRNAITTAYYDEEKFRHSLWKVMKRNEKFTQPCSCGAEVYIKIRYEVAALRKQELPVARRKLEGILREVQDDYCHHQHAVLLAHSQIEDLLIEIMHGNTLGIREALALILQALRFSYTSPPALAASLTRWATALSAALDTSRDTRQLLFLIHHLFRQSHSVRWAAGAVRMSCNDSIQAARAIMLLDLLLNKPKFELAKDCTEEVAEDWEEVDKSGGTGSVAEGSLRERDLLALVAAFPLREIAARLLTCDKADVSTISENDLIDPYGGHNILKCCYGTRTLIAVVQKALATHSRYRQLRNELTHMAAKLAEGLAQLHLYMIDSNAYKPQIATHITAELHDIFSCLRDMLYPDKLELLPTSLLTEEAAMFYCNDYMSKMHASGLQCGACVRAAAAATCARAADPGLAAAVLPLLIQNGLCKKANPCKLGCEAASRECIAKLLETHPYMQTIALHMVAELSQSNTIDPAKLSSLCLARWRPQAGELSAVLQLVARSCPVILEQLLLNLEYTPHVGLSLEAQLAIGSFLCDWLRQATPPGPDWPWAVLRKLRPHRTSWNLSLDVPPPENEEGLFALAYAILSSSWGHCIPLICSKGVEALIKLATVRADVAVHCLGDVMLVMQYSPESISLTKQFGELFDILLNSGPSLVQRALGVGGPSGGQLLQELVFEQLANNRYGDKSSLLTAWFHGLFRAGSTPGLVIADAALRSCRLWSAVDHFLNTVLQGPDSSTLVSSTLSSAASAPLLAECVLRHAHAQQLIQGTFESVCTAVHAQKLSGLKINVDHALKLIGSSVASEDLCIFSCSGCVLAAPAHHPAHLTLWRMLMHLYLQTPVDTNEQTAPVGPLFFSGYYKSRVLYQLKKRIQEHITYHHNQSEIYTKKCQSHPRSQPSTASTVRRRKVTDDYDVNILPSVSIENLTGDSDTDSGDGGSEGESEQVSDTSEGDRLRREEIEMQNYHLGAEKMLHEYARWLQEGEQTRARPYNADIARFISEVALDTAWRLSLQYVSKPEHIPTVPFPPQKTHFEILKEALFSIKTARRRRNRIALRSTLEDVDVRDARNLLSVVVKHLSHLEILAREFTMESNYITSLDNQLVQLVCSLRVPRTLPPRVLRCQNNCSPVTMIFTAQEWCVCENTERAIKENRSAALSALKKLARPRTHSVYTVAALHTLARHVRSAETARRVLEAAYSTAEHVHKCALARELITDLVDLLAERWISHDGTLCSSMLYTWCQSTNPLQQHFCVAVVDPRKLNKEHWLEVYLTVVRSLLPSHVVFSLLSKFDTSRWSETASDSQRLTAVLALLKLLKTWGPVPEKDTLVLLELCGVQSTSLVGAKQFSVFVTSCARASVTRILAVEFLPHVERVCSLVGPTVDMDQLGHLLREVGTIWATARANKEQETDYSLYAVPTARLLISLQRAFVAAAVHLSYEPERVVHYSWASIQESWYPWVHAHRFPPLVPPTSEAGSAVFTMYRDVIAQVMMDCPGTEVHLLRNSFNFLVQHLLYSEQHVTSLLAAMTSLPWTRHQWMDGMSVQAAVQVANSENIELKSWASSCWRNVTAAGWMADSADVVDRLVVLLDVFTAKISISEQTIQASFDLPWYRLPSPALEAALHKYFTLHHNVCLPYHENTHFTILLHASGIISPAINPNAHDAGILQENRAIFLSHWTRAMCDAALTAHVASAQKYLLQLIAQLAPSRDPSSLESLLARAVVVMCIETAAAEAAPVWVSWLSSANKQLLEASLTAVCSLTNLDYFAIVGEAAVRAYINLPESSWRVPCSRWRGCSWVRAQCARLLQRGGVHAALVLLVLRAPAPHSPAGTRAGTRAALVALRAADVHFGQNELILSVLICHLSRVVSRYLGSSDSCQQDCVEAAHALLRWADEKKSLLNTLGLQGSRNVPTDRIRLLCRLAQCILDPTNEKYPRAFEAACPTVLGSSPGDVVTWGRQPDPSKLVRLAMRMFPDKDRYFQIELDEHYPARSETV